MSRYQGPPNPWVEKDAKKRASHPKRYAVALLSAIDNCHVTDYT